MVKQAITIALLLSSVIGQASQPIPESVVQFYLRDAGFPEYAVPVMLCIAKYESNFNAKAVNKNRNGTQDRGVFQINERNLKLCDLKKRDQLFDLHTNVVCALKVWQWQGYNAWVVSKKVAKECIKKISINEPEEVQ